METDYLPISILRQPADIHGILLTLCLYSSISTQSALNLIYALRLGMFDFQFSHFIWNRQQVTTLWASSVQKASSFMIGLVVWVTWASSSKNFWPTMSLVCSLHGYTISFAFVYLWLQFVFVIKQVKVLDFNDMVTSLPLPPSSIIINLNYWMG